MLRTMLTLLSIVAVVGATSPAVAGDCKGCKAVAKKGEGFHCGKGQIFGVKLASQKLYESLAGKEIDAANIKCAGCKTAVETSGKCEHCKVAMANGRVYHSMVGHTLAKGMPVTAKKAAKCGGCKTAHKENGFCKHCRVGFVAGRVFAAKKVYEAATKAFETLAKAVETAPKCEVCAVAMVTDGRCDSCDVSFKDGKKISPAGG